MRAISLLTMSAAALAVAGCATYDNTASGQVGQATLLTSNGTPAGSAQLMSDGQTLSLAVMANGLKPGEHGFHLHTTGLCEAPDFQSAGGHLNPEGNEHGSLNPQGKHLGDLPNLSVGASGTARTEVDLGRDTPQLRSQLFDSDGTAVMIHSGPDDYRSDPAGDAGSRVACGVMTTAG